MRLLLILVLSFSLMLLGAAPVLVRAGPELAIAPARSEVEFPEPLSMDWRVCAAATGGVVLFGIIILIRCGGRRDHRRDGWGMYR